MTVEGGLMDKESFIMLGAVALIGVFAILLSAQDSVTGAHSWLTVKYRSCHYADQDSFGTCMRIERQTGPQCSPPETAYRYQGETGWFWRLCAPNFGSQKY
jgi:hypothetical protein